MIEDLEQICENNPIKLETLQNIIQHLTQLELKPIRF